MLDVRRVAEGETRVNDMLRGTDPQADTGDIALWARRVSYWRGYADALYFAMTIVDRTVLGEKPQP